MMSRRRSFLSLGMILLILAMPWAAAAGSSGRGEGEDIQEEVKISTQKQVDYDRVEILVEFENLSENTSYDFVITITRVDPNFAHQVFTGNFNGTEVGEHTVTEYWTPDQDGPYTVNTSLIYYEQTLASDTDTFEWGDVPSNSASASVMITANPNQDYYDVAGNEEAQNDVIFGFGSDNLEIGGSYHMRISLFRLDESGNPDQDVELFGFSLSQGNNAHYNMSTLAGLMWPDTDWMDDTDYRLRLELFLDNGLSEELALTTIDELTFTVGEAPPPLEDLLGLEFNCDFGDYDVWHMVLEEGDTGQARGTGLNCTIYNPNVVTVAGTVNVSATGVPNGAGIDSNLNPYSIEADSSRAAFLSFDCGGGNCVVTNGTANFQFDFTEENHTYWNDATVTHTIDFEILGNQTIITPEPILGCKDQYAENFNPNATDDDGSCIYLEPMRVLLTANQTTGEAPLSVAFVANVSQGRMPYEISWDFDDGTTAEGLVTINHTFYTAGVYNVVLQVTDSDGFILERGIQIIATEPPVIGNLTGYISHSGQLEPINKDMVASVEFYGTASGGEGPYTFTWKFGDDSEGEGSTILHEFGRTGKFTVELTIEDSAGRTLQLEENITLVKNGEEGGVITPPEEGLDGDGSNFDIYATSTGAIGLLLIFGMFGRKRRESFLDAQRRKAHGEGSMWD